MKQSARRRATPCPARPCVLPLGPNGHDMANAANKGALGLPVLIHRDRDGREWTVHGPFVREQRPEVGRG